MVRVLLSFVGSFVGGGVLIYALCHLGFRVWHPNGAMAAPTLNMTPAEYEVWMNTVVERNIQFLSVVGAVFAGILCGMWAMSSGRRSAHSSQTRAHRPNWASPTEAMLTREEFERLARAVLCVDLSAKELGYLQGFLVGSFLESAPELAAKIDSFSEAHLEAVREDLIAYRRRLA